MVVLLLRLLLDFLACLHFVFRKQFLNALAVLRAYPAFLLHLPLTIQKRIALNKTIRAMSIGPAKANLYKGSILFDYYLRGKHFFTQLTRRSYATAKSTGNPV
jgi:hypothetical protein